MNLLDALVNQVPAAQDRVTRPIVIPLNGLAEALGLVKKAERLPAVQPAARNIGKPLTAVESKLNTILAEVNKPFDAVNSAVDQTIGLGFLRDMAEKAGMVNSANYDMSLPGLLRYIIQAQNEPDRPNITLDTNGMLPAAYEYKPTLKMYGNE